MISGVHSILEKLSEVIAPPSAPCYLAANTGSSAVVGVGDYNFTNWLFDPGVSPSFF